MKLLRDVVKHGAPWSDREWDAGDSDREEPWRYYGPQQGECHECGWMYSAHAEQIGLIRHNDYCSRHNPDGLWEFG